MLPVPRPATVADVVTLNVVDAPAVRVAEAPPLEANTAEAIWGTPETVKLAVRVAPLTLVIWKTFVKVRADGTVPKSSERALTFPEATDVEVPGCTALPG